MTSLDICWGYTPSFRDSELIKEDDERTKRNREFLLKFVSTRFLKSGKFLSVVTFSPCKKWVIVKEYIYQGNQWLLVKVKRLIRQGKQLIVIAILIFKSWDLAGSVEQTPINKPVGWNGITIEQLSSSPGLAKFSKQEHEALFPQQESYKIIKNVDWRANGLTPKPQYGHPRPNRSGVPGVNPPPGTLIGTPFSSITKGSAGSNSGQFGTGKVTNEPVGVSRSATNLSAKKTGSSSQSNSKELEQFDQPRAANDPAIIDVKHSFEENKSLKKVTQRALNNQDVARDYKSIQRKLEDGVDPIEIGNRATDLGDGITYVRTKHSRFVVKTIDMKTEDIIGIAYRGKRQDMKTLARVMNEQYGVDINEGAY